MYNSESDLPLPVFPEENIERKPHCCCCGKELTYTDIHYYDLSNYCIKCAIADGIRESE